MLCWTKYKGYAYDVDYRDPNMTLTTVTLNFVQ